MQVALETLDIQFNKQWDSLPRALGDPSISVWNFTPIIDSTDSQPEPNLEINGSIDSYCQSETLMQVALETLDIQFNRQWDSLPRALGDPSILVWSFTPIIDSTDSQPEPNLETNGSIDSYCQSETRCRLL